MSNQYQSKPALTDALAGKLKKGESSRGLKIIDDTKNYTGNETVVNDSRISNSIILDHSQISNLNCQNSFVGSHTIIEGETKDLSLGDYSKIKF